MSIGLTHCLVLQFNRISWTKNELHYVQLLLANVCEKLKGIHF